MKTIKIQPFTFYFGFLLIVSLIFFSCLKEPTLPTGGNSTSNSGSTGNSGTSGINTGGTNSSGTNTGGTNTGGNNTGGGSSAGYNCVSGNCNYVSSNAQYTTFSACQNACASTAKGQVLIWTSLRDYNFRPANCTRCNSSVLNIDKPSGGLGSISTGGNYSSAPSCGATYGETISLAPGTYSIRGWCSYIKLLDGHKCPNLSITKQVTVYANQCTPVHFP